jgi:4-amino-4-deoxy-L-arabinose transferase-like glycosyltransferase
MQHLEKLDRWVERRGGWPLAALLAYAFARSVVAASAKSLWYDELLTQLVVAQGNWHGIMKALLAPVDGQPPLFYVIEHVASKLAANQLIALRLPSAAGVVCTLLCAFLYTRRRSGNVVALLSSMFLLISVVFQLYALEARPYSIVLACITFALVCYQRAQSPIWVVLMALSLAAAQSLHYLAVLTLVPFGLAEIAQSLETKKVRWGVWAALSFAVVPLILMLKLLLLNKAYYGAHFWALGFHFAEIPQMYQAFFQTSSKIAIAIATTALAGVVATTEWRPKRTDAEPASAGLSPRQEAVLLLALATLPFTAYVFTNLTNSGMTPRYVLPAVVGVSLAFGYTLARGPRKGVVLFAAFVVTAVAVNELHFWRFVKAQRREVESKSVATESFLASVGHDNLAVVVPHGDTYLWMERNLAAPARLVYLRQDTEGEHATMDQGLALVPRFAPMQVRRVSEFLEGNREFLVYGEGEDFGKDWLTRRLVGQGWMVQAIRYEGFRQVFLVRAADSGEIPQGRRAGVSTVPTR